MSKSTLFISILLLLTIVIFGFLTYKVMQPPVRQVSPSQIINQDGTLNNPLDINNPAILSARLAFTIEGEITALDKIGSEIQILIKPDINNLPILVTDSNTRVFQFENNSFIKKDLEFLNVGQQIRIFLFYGLKTRLWRLAQINVLPN